MTITKVLQPRDDTARKEEGWFDTIADCVDPTIQGLEEFI